MQHDQPDCREEISQKYSFAPNRITRGRGTGDRPEDRRAESAGFIVTADLPEPAGL